MAITADVIEVKVQRKKVTLGNPPLTEIYLFCHLQGCRNIEEEDGGKRNKGQSSGSIAAK